MPADLGSRRDEDDAAAIRRNPFATRYVASARIDSRDETGRLLDLGALADRLELAGGRGAIVGPHGAGKSTLLVQLADVLERRGAAVRHLRVRRPHDLPEVLLRLREVPCGGIASIDGWEVLGRIGRLVARAMVRKRRLGLIVTAHRPGWPATLMECRTSLPLLRSIVATLPGEETWFGTVIFDDDLAACFAAGGGDVRFSLDLLYDRFEGRARPMFPSAGGAPAGAA